MRGETYSRSATRADEICKKRSSPLAAAAAPLPCGRWPKVEEERNKEEIGKEINA